MDFCENCLIQILLARSYKINYPPSIVKKWPIICLTYGR